jgi:PAS domain S-box-containing protein
VTSRPKARSGEAAKRPALQEDEALRLLFEGTARETGDQFFRALVRTLAKALDTHGAWVTEYDPVARRLRALAFWMGDEFIPWEAAIDGTPCEVVVTEKRLVHVKDHVLDAYPGDPDLRSKGVRSYMGVPLKGSDDSIIGHLAVLDVRPLPDEPRLITVFELFAERAAAELRRLRAEMAVREREEKLARLVDGAMDAIIELDQDLRLTHVNSAAEKVFDRPGTALVGAPFASLLAAGERERIGEVVRELDACVDGPSHVWIAGGLRAQSAAGVEFPAEATISRHRREGRTFHTVVLRNVNDRLLAEERIRALQEEIREREGFGGIIGESPRIHSVLREIDEVAATDASVLILGETGTGKELVARAIHARSQRRDKPLVTVNAGAIPTNLIESELFGHEKGAFTGATERRDGRFALAHGGTIFLDEIGELPLDLQVKLLRVLQEGQFEPLGSAKTRKVDVRVISATNRDLPAMVRDGSFRQDLYYRLNVYPITIPPLRERGGDAVLLAKHFAARFARKMGRTLTPLSRESEERLTRYEWPGNVRELANVVERAVIGARDGRLDLGRVLPRVGDEPAALAPAASDRGGIRTARELEDLERENIRRALAASAGKVSGPEGAAERLGLKPSTLSSRMKALGIPRTS